MRDPDRNHPVDAFLRHTAGDPTPNAADRAHAERALNRAISDAKTAEMPERHRWHWTLPALAGSLALILVAIVALQITRPSAAAAALAEIAAAAELADPINIPTQSYAYTKSESTVRGVVPADAVDGRDRSLAYLLPQTREVWIGPEGTVQIRTTTRSPVFFTAEDEHDYYAAELDEVDGVNETVTLTGTDLASLLDERDWPTTPDSLRTAINESLPPDSAKPHNTAMAELALGLVTETAATPELKAAALQLLATLDDITLDKRLPDGGGTFSMTYDQPVPTRLAFTLDGDGNVLLISSTDIEGDATTGIPPNTPTENTSYQPTRIVSSLGSP